MRNKEVIKNVPTKEKIAEWDAKETVEGSKQKADKALNDAKAYADEHKVEKVLNKQLSTEDFTTEEKTKLALLQNYTHPLKHTTDEITTNSNARFVSDVQIKDWTEKETVEGAKAKADKALADSKIYIDSQINPLKSEKLDFAEINQSRQLVLKANGAIKYTLQLPLGGGEGSSSYVLPPATSTLLGGVKIGAGISVKDDGTISVNMSDIGSIDWSNISGIPLEFAPSAHTHNRSDIVGLFNVINNLQSDSETDALSAKQGKELKTLIENSSSHAHENLDALNLITSENIESWNGKETVSGSQDKANKALSEAKAYADNKLRLVPTMQYYKTDVRDTDWSIFDDEASLYKTTVSHNLGCREIIVEAFNELGISEFVSYRVVDNNSIEIFSELQSNLKVSILGLTKKE